MLTDAESDESSGSALDEPALYGRRCDTAPSDTPPIQTHTMDAAELQARA
jgi:hypothetical protein